MKKYDVVLLTEKKYVNPKEIDWFTQNILTENNLVKEALEEKGLNVIIKSWDDKEFDWSKAKYLLFRTVWDYFHRYDEFSKWLDKTAILSNHINSMEQIRWNVDKHYLVELEEKGVNIAPTVIIEKETQTTLQDLHFEYNWKETVLKPVISGSARHTYKLNLDNLDSHEKTFQQLISNEAMMLQPFQKNIIDIGEVSMIMIGGKYTHAVLKKAKKGDFRVQDDFGGSIQEYTPSTAEIEFAEFVISKCDPLPLYGRVDIFIDNNGKPAVAEVELIEPELWFRLNPLAAKSLANEISKLPF